MMRNVVAACRKRLAGQVANAAHQIYKASSRRLSLAVCSAYNGPDHRLKPDNRAQVAQTACTV
jgi:hypothetical protein